MQTDSSSLLVLLGCAAGLLASAAFWGALASSIYSSKGRSPRSGFWLGFVFGLFGMLYAVAASDTSGRPLASERQRGPDGSK